MTGCSILNQQAHQVVVFMGQHKISNNIVQQMQCSIVQHTLLGWVLVFIGLLYLYGSFYIEHAWMLMWKGVVVYGICTNTAFVLHCQLSHKNIDLNLTVICIFYFFEFTHHKCSQCWVQQQNLYYKMWCRSYQCCRTDNSQQERRSPYKHLDPSSDKSYHILRVEQ